MKNVEVAAVAALNAQGEMLWGKRKDCGKWTTPAGHKEEGETDEDCARRELKEEANLEPKDKMDYLGVEHIVKEGEDLAIHCFSCEVTGTPSSENDPDEEVEEWRWVNITDGLPKEIEDNLYAPKNVLLRLLRLQGKEKEEHMKVTAIMAAAMLGIAPSPTAKSEAQAHITQAPPKAKEAAPVEVASHWSTKGLAPGLRQIAVLESGFGENTNHAASPDGEFDTAYGPLGLKTSSAYDLYSKYTHLRTAYPGLDDKADFEARFKSDWGFYNAMASAFWREMHWLFKDHRAVYAWRHGPGAASVASDEQVAEDSYTRRYFSMHKSEKEWQELEDKLHEKPVIPLKKAEGDDPIMNLLRHPQRAERLLALRLPGVTDKHLELAVQDSDPAVVQAALKHPAARAATIQSAIRTGRYDAIQEALNHPKFDERHLDYLLHSPSKQVMVAAAKHPTITPDQTEYLLNHPGIDPAVKRAAISNQSILPHQLYDLVNTAIERPHDGQAQVFAMDALSHPRCPSKARGAAYNDGRAAFVDALNTPSDLVKAIKPEHLSKLGRATATHGASTVDHTIHISAHPESIQADVDHYHNDIMGGSTMVQPMKLPKDEDGISPKTIVQDADGRRFMLKPYHEVVAKVTNTYAKAPIQGWAEMANQGLYHAAGIGYLHQKVHVSEHNMGPGMEREPSLVIHMAHNDDDTEWMTSNKAMKQNLHQHDQEHTRFQARQIGLMDFLANNLDRHHNNLLYDGGSGNLLSVDNSRSFQYNRPGHLKWTKDGAFKKSSDNDVDALVHYLSSGVLSGTGIPTWAGFSKNASVSTPEAQEGMNKVMQWWQDASPKVKEEFERHLTAIKDEHLRDHLRRNFHARAEHLDYMSKFPMEDQGDDWDVTAVPLYHRPKV